jgi:hypothetical protein
VTQLEWAENISQELREAVDTLSGPLSELDLLLSQAQNSPPRGASDGTLSPEHYNKLRALHSAFAGVKLSMRVLPR